MNKLEEIFQKNTIIDFRYGEIIVSLDQFKSAIREVVNEILVSDEEIEKYAFETYYRYEDARLNGPTQQSAKWSRDLSKQKLENLLK